MSRSRDRESGRRRHTIRRLFFFLLVPLVTASPGISIGQDERTANAESTRSIRERQVRITYGPAGDYRVVEVLTVAASASERSAAPLALIRPGPRAFDVIGLGGDVETSQVIHVAPDVRLNPPVPDGAFQIGLGYRIPADIPRIELTADLPTDRLLVLIDRGGLEAQMDVPLELDGVEGTPARPIVRYATRNVEAGTAIVIGLRNGRIGWRQRLAVLAAACLAAGTSALLVRRRDRVRRPPTPS